VPDLRALAGRAAQAAGVDLPSAPPDLAALAQTLPPGLTSAAGAAAGAVSGAGGALAAAALPSIDEIYETVLERLRRDLLAERERMGDLLGNIGH
jgi:hypothetical protein